jgi:hypothetical protein
MAAPVQELTCLRCLLPTTLSDSTPNSKNLLKRVCCSCGATERYLNRQAKQKDNETPAQTAGRLAAQKTKAAVSKMSPEEKAAWFREEAAKRAAETKRSRRSFGTAVGMAEEEREQSLLNDSVDKWLPFEEWAMREIVLGRCTPHTAEAEFKLACSAPDAVVRKIKGETCIRRFTGGETRARDSHGLRTTVKQRMDVETEEELAVFQELAAARHSRAADLLSADQLVRDSTGEARSSSLLTVAADVAACRKEAEDRDAEWLEKAQAQEKKKEDKAQAGAVLKTVTLEKLNYQQVLVKSEHAAQDLLFKLRTSLATAKEDAQAALAKAGEEVQRESREQLTELEKAVEPVRREVEEFLRTAVRPKPPSPRP